MSLTKVSYSMIDGAVFNVLDYGAVGDNSNNDTTAIQAAVDAAAAAGGGTVYFPVGAYKITSSISMKLNVCLLGASGRASRLVQYTNSTSCLSFARNAGIFNDITSLGFTVNAGVTGVTLLNIGSDVGVGGVGNINITSCNFNGGATAINIDAGYYINIYGCFFANQTAYGVKLVGDGGANANNIFGCNFNVITGYAVYIVRDSGGATFQVSVINNNFEAITGDAIYCPQTGVYTFSSNYFEAVSGSEIVVPGTACVSGIGNYSADGASILDFSTPARGVFAVSPITASGDVRVNLGGTVITSNGNTQLDITNSAGVDQVWAASTTSFIGKNFRTGTYLGLTAITPASAINNSIFVSNVDNKLYFKDSGGVDRALY